VYWTGTAGNLQLIAREGDRYAVVDSLLREWVARQTF